MRKNILILAIGFLPNIGGLETHLKDLIDELLKRDWRVTVLTYQPLNTPTLGKWIERQKNATIFRLPVFRGLFYKLLKIPVMEFIYLEPLFFLITPAILLRYPQIQVVNGQGIIAGFSAAFWSKIFGKRYVVSVQSVYNFPKKGLYRQISSWIFKSADKIIAISKQAKQDVESLGVNPDKIQLYTNWENSDFFKPQNREIAKRKVGFEGKFVVSFFGRLIEEKGIKVFIESIELLDKGITLAVYGEGPLKDYVKKAARKYNNVYYMGIVTPDSLPLHYSAADIVLMPTLNEEGFGRVAAGALFCGTPVIASNRGALPEVVNERVGKIIDPIAQEIAKAVNFYYANPKILRKCALNARKYAMFKFSSKNVQNILHAFEGRIL
ncbi:MAG: glycosyltransferase family 4 protein [Candidatus Daviesbacteria bacterium]|nr:glycosyltransferase family 4 protein [Candidatus Daviesbacteria bacterium]